jgi:serine protease Do
MQITMQKSFYLFTLLYAALTFGGCASFMNGRTQNISIYTDKADAKIYLDGKPVGSGKWTKAKVARDLEVHQIKVEAKGYKPEYGIAYQRKKSGLRVLSFIPFGAFIYPLFLDVGPRSWNFEKEYTVKPVLKTKTRAENQKYIYLRSTSFDVKKEDLVLEEYRYRQFKNNKKTINVSTSRKEIELTNSIFTDALNDILKSNGFIDTTNSVLKSKTNTLYINAKVSKILFKQVLAPRARYNTGKPSYCLAEITVDWELQDIYDQSKAKRTIVTSSGYFAVDPGEETANNFVLNSTEDALMISFFQFLNDPAIDGILNIDRNKKENLVTLKIEKGAAKQQTLKNAQASTVSITTKKGHGSGCMISSKGHVLTNYHVIAGQKDIDVILNNGEKLKATFIRASEDGDLALLLLDNPPQTLSFFKLPEKETYDLGDEVFAIGTPQSLELSQTLSKGIISGFRKLPDNSQLIQTDVSVNPGNSGGALVNKQGELLGIVNSKLMGFGVEGISFCIPATQINRILALE